MIPLAKLMRVTNTKANKGNLADKKTDEHRYSTLILSYLNISPNSFQYTNKALFNYLINLD